MTALCHAAGPESSAVCLGRSDDVPPNAECLRVASDCAWTADPPSRDQEGTPLLFRAANISAFVEGWGLYAETLRDELGLYDADPLARIGMIQSFLFRATRLVVDTGMHAMGWGRDRAIRTFMDNVGRNQSGTEREIDRYQVWPGQATSYKIGHNEILRIREQTRRRLGSRFDIKAFHDLVLLSGDMPLEVLASMAGEWNGARLT